MATLLEVESWLREVEYTPGSRIMFVPAPLPSGEFALEVRLQVKDSYRPDQTIEVRHHRPAPPLQVFRDRDQFRGWLAHELREVACHESDEWFRDRGSGRPVFDPHATRPGN